MPTQELAGKTAIVSGASRGIGKAAAAAMLSDGANVVVTARSQEAADEAAADLGERCVGFAAHAAHEDEAIACAQFAIDTFGSLDILVNNAATNAAYGPLIEQDYKAFAKTIEVNLWAPLMWTRVVWDAWMKEHGGSIVHTASNGGIQIAAQIGVYNASKAALIHMTKQLAVELGPNVRVNSIAPGLVRTRLAEALWRDHEEEMNAVIPLGRIGEPEDIGLAIAFLAGPRGRWINGETLVADGGQMYGQVMQ